MMNGDNEQLPAENATTYTILIEGVLDAAWSEWFDGMAISHGPDGTTAISGEVVDQAALHRVIRKLRDLGTPLVSVQRSEL